tara:strand:- start:2528 stop:2692 length:165 start_codon:yes stop_codon:yes gene_type:complete
MSESTEDFLERFEQFLMKEVGENWYYEFTMEEDSTLYFKVLNVWGEQFKEDNDE